MRTFDLRKYASGNRSLITRLVSFVRKQKFARAVDLCAFVIALVELCLRENVVHFEAAHLAQHAGLERQSRAPVPALLPSVSANREPG